MTKKIIAALMVATVLFVCVFTACGKQKYTNPQTGKKYEIVTDEEGKRVLSDDGELLVYETDDNGKYVTDANGEKVTQAQGFVGQVEFENGVIEDYAYRLQLPDGWKADKDTFGVFVNKSKNQKVDIEIVEYLFDDYYERNKDTYDMIKKNAEEGVSVTWEDDVDLAKGATNACRFTMTTNDSCSILCFFENSGNVYKILYTSDTKDGAVESLTGFCKGFSFKPYQYYTDVTAVSKD